MKTFKQIDWRLQAALIISSMVILFVDESPYEPFYGYFIVGGFQFVSIVIHEINGSFISKGSRRRYYHNAVYIIVSIMLLSIILTPLLVIFLPMLFAGPLMAFYYLYTCYDEVMHHMQRPLSQLK